MVVANAARTGAETGATRRYTDFTRASWEANIRSAVVDELSSLPEFDESEMSFDVATSVDSEGVVQVAVDVEYPFRNLVAWPGLPTEVMLHEHIKFCQFR